MVLRKTGLVVSAVLAALIVLAGGAVWLSTAYQTPLSRHLPAELKPRVFPAVETTGLDPARVRILENVRREFDANRPGTHYSEGVDEPWCADFVSTVLRDSGLPLRNPNSGTWRIPGVYTLTEYFQSQGRFRGPEHVPTAGDVALYAPGHPLGQHTNFVVAVADGTVSTVGGNQPGGVSAYTFRHSDSSGVVGYGVPVG
ncbi:MULTISPECIES: CHAP domain-containing protein [Tsukamurella]|uniref:CHAP domain-containing protein n=2 Tax=Tsukamurella TaxID=2060 RepID=A0A5C5S661_9ACTN|nr:MULTISPECIES: CHAP domain-containing protein [Tsukamurella]NMD57523.1 CHAP domain-containing protein [Tsukamurella columbiensis]TWS30927.1 CHAP domain-containing protein [Tsukamurella conjunctivitidis]